MKNQDIYNFAVSFRAAILEAKYNREFDRSDRMSHFPAGCCDDSCDLLAYYLYTEYGINTKQRNGVNGKYFPAKNGIYFPAFLGK